MSSVKSYEKLDKQFEEHELGLNQNILYLWKGWFGSWNANN